MQFFLDLEYIPLRLYMVRVHVQKLFELILFFVWSYYWFGIQLGNRSLNLCLCTLLEFAFWLILFSEFVKHISKVKTIIPKKLHLYPFTFHSVFSYPFHKPWFLIYPSYIPCFSKNSQKHTCGYLCTLACAPPLFLMQKIA